MKKRNIAKIVILAAVGLVIFLGVKAENFRNAKAECTESMEDCCKKQDVQGKKMIWESLPQQFFSSF